jgi:hypothetical protein
MRVHRAQPRGLRAPRRTVLALAVLAVVAVGLASAAITPRAPAAGSVTVAGALAKANAWKKITVGPGLAEASSRQVIRTAEGRVYVFAADDTAQKAGAGPGVIRAYRADETGMPSSFTETDGDQRPTGLAPDGVLGGPDVRLDSNGLAHVLYVDKATGALVYRVFSTLTDTWGPATTIADGVEVGTHPFKRGETASALVLDANDAVHVVYVSFGSILYTRTSEGTWTAPETVATGTEPIHPQLAAEADGDLQVVWLEQGPTPRVRWAERSAGAWSTPETVAADVLGNTNLDQGPSIVLDSSSHPRVVFLSCCAPSTTYVQVMVRTGSGWVPDTLPYDLYAHTPQIYGRGDDAYVFLGHDEQIRFGYAYHLSGETWSAYTPLTSLAEGELDGSASARWDPLHETDPNIIDVAFFDEDKNGDQTWLPELYYMAVLPSDASSPADRTPPSVALAAPPDGSTVSGSVTVSADAADDIGVAGVVFHVDGVPVGGEDSGAPYAVTWDTTTVGDGSHTLTALARDEAGNVRISASRTVTVDNTGSATPGERLLGEGTILGYTDFNAAGTAEAFQVTASAPGILRTMHLYLDATSTASSVLVAIYSDLGGHPGLWLDEGSLAGSALVAGDWNSIPLLGHVKVSAGAKYWIALLTPAGGGEIRFRDVGMGQGSSPSETSFGTGLTGSPNPWVSGSSYVDGPVSVYGTS